VVEPLLRKATMVGRRRWVFQDECLELLEEVAAIARDLRSKLVATIFVQFQLLGVRRMARIGSDLNARPQRGAKVAAVG
jgi:hypothetical protein